ncbi:hypothetical protein [Clostridium sp.]|jgi:hypothetical protein|uniref:hypothetical protein n=1 Tax=Clostridium sp. TaxID=1506 RepID=UPI003EEC83AA
MDKGSEEIAPKNNSEPLINSFNPKIKKCDYKLMIFWIILGVLSLVLLYYAYEMLFIYF